jgi:hypothetical protein
MLAAFLALTRGMLRALRPGAPHAGAAVLLCAFTPVFAYLGFKTVAEIPALLLAAVAAYAFLRSLRSRPVAWLPLVALAVAGVAFTKNHLVLLPVSLIGALVLVGGRGFRVSRVLAHAVVSGLASLVLFFALLRIAGIPLERYLVVWKFQETIHDPVEAKFLSLALELGPFFLALPLAFLGPRKGDARFFALWFALATLPMLLSRRVEDRYLVANLVPLAGLAGLSIEGLAPAIRRRWSSHRPASIAAALIAAAVLVGPTALAQKVMFHGVQAGQLRELLRRLDVAYGRDGYVIVTPSEYTTFLYLRFVEPDRPVYTVFTAGPPDHRDPAAWPGFQRRHFGARALQSAEEAAAVGARMVYVGPESDLSVADLGALVQSVPSARLRAAGESFIRRMDPFNPLVLSWMWRDPRIRLTDDLHHGHYAAMGVEILPATP